MLALARDGDLGCRRVIADAGRVVGSAAAFVFNVLNPQRLVVGGDLAAAGDLLLDGVRELRAPRGAARRRRRRDASSPACSASARRCSARSRWRSARPTRRSIFPHPSTNRFPEGEFHEEGSRLARHRSGRDERRGRRVRRRRGGARAAAAARTEESRRRRRRQGRGPAAGLEVVGALGDGRPAVAAGGVRGGRRRGRRSRTPRATRRRSSSRPSRRSPTGRRSSCWSTSTRAPAPRSRRTPSRRASRSSTTTA